VTAPVEVGSQEVMREAREVEGETRRGVTHAIIPRSASKSSKSRSEAQKYDGLEMTRPAMKGPHASVRLARPIVLVIVSKSSQRRSLVAMSLSPFGSLPYILDVR
jgi:hypothetical protein